MAAHVSDWFIAGLWIVGFSLWIVPVFIYRYARRNGSSHACRAAGIALGAVASMASFGTYSMYWVLGVFGLMGLPLAAIGILGLLLTMFHEAPGFYFATIPGLRSGGVVHGIETLYIESLNSVIWAIVHGGIGYALDSVVVRRRTRN